jgi:MYXO-CTERM domain-containing protein
MATLVIDQDVDSTSIDLVGNATGDGGGGNVDSGTYYDCSAGRPGAAWPLGIALLAMRRRRRHA